MVGPESVDLAAFVERESARFHRPGSVSGLRLRVLRLLADLLVPLECLVEHRPMFVLAGRHVQHTDERPQDALVRELPGEVRVAIPNRALVIRVRWPKSAMSCSRTRRGGTSTVTLPSLRWASCGGILANNADRDTRERAMANDFSGDEYVDAAKTLGSITELVLLDRFWTHETKATSSGGQGAGDLDRIESLETIVAELERLLVDVELRSRRIAAAASRRRSQLEENFKALTGDQSPFTPAQREKLVELVNNRSQGDVAAFADAAVADLAAQLEPERKLLKDELDRIKKGGRSNGDMSADEERALAELAVLSSVVFGPEAGVIVEAVGHLLDWLFG